MSAVILQELERLRSAVDAAAVVLWERVGPSGEAFVAAAVPSGLLLTGTPWPGHPGEAAPRFADSPRSLGAMVPSGLRLTLGRPGVAGWSGPMPDPRFGLCVVWSASPQPSAVSNVEEAVAGSLGTRAAEFRMRERLDADFRRLRTVIGLLDQAVVTIDEIRGTATANQAATQLLGLPDGDLTAVAASQALAGLQSRALDREAVEAVARRLVVNPLSRVQRIVWSFADDPTHLSVSSSPVDDTGLAGRVWVFDDISVQMRLLTEAEDARSRYLMLAENASDIVFRGTLDGVLEWVSESVAATLGWEPAQLVGRPIAELIMEEDRLAQASALEETARSAGTDSRSTYRARFLCQDGSVRWLEISARGVRDEAGRLVARIGSARDIQQQVAVQQALELSESRLRAITDGMLDPQVLMAPVRNSAGQIVDFTYLEVNRVTGEYLSMPREALIGASLLETTPGVRETGLFALYVQAMMTDEPVIVDDFLYDNVLLGLTRRYDVRATRVGEELTLTWRDVTERFESRQQIADSEERYRLLAENATDIIGHARGGVVAWISPSVQDAFGVSAQEWIGRPIHDLVHPDDVVALDNLEPALREGRMGSLRLRMRSPDGATEHWVGARIRSYRDRDGHPDGMIASLRVIDELVQAEAELDLRARFDTLTGLANRGELMSRFGDLTHHVRRSGEAIALLFCDVDRFKSINDEHGHAAGDSALAVLAERLTSAIRTEDIAARMGGDEFLVLLVGVHGMNDAVSVAEKLRTLAEQPIAVGDGWLRTSLSIGVALASPGEGIDAIMARADTAMYEAKRGGRNQVVSIQGQNSDGQP